VALLGGGLLVLLLLNISIGKGAYALTELQAQQRQLTESQQLLAEQVESASAPEQLAASARKLGMVPAPNAVFVRLPDGTVEGKPAIARAPAKKTDAKPKTAANSKQGAKSGSSSTGTTQVGPSTGTTSADKSANKQPATAQR
jgi:hypothetical protein